MEPPSQPMANHMVRDLIKGQVVIAKGTRTAISLRAEDPPDLAILKQEDIMPAVEDSSSSTPPTLLTNSRGRPTTLMPLPSSTMMVPRMRARASTSKVPSHKLRASLSRILSPSTKGLLDSSNKVWSWGPRTRRPKVKLLMPLAKLVTNTHKKKRGHRLPPQASLLTSTSKRTLP